MAIRPAQGAVLQRLQGEPAALELVLYHDVLCSWCYVADARLEYLRDEYGPLVRWRLRPYPLRPENQLPERYGVDDQQVPTEIGGQLAYPFRQ